MPDQRPIEFGKRRLVAPGPPIKRSGHVALLLMGTLAVGGGAYALMPGATCEPASPQMAAPALPQTNAACSTRRSSGGSGGGGRSSRYGFFGDSSSRSASVVSSDSSSSSVTRGGFGSFARAFGFSGHG
jgi:hypothetical protein